ncbi:MAG TPA: nitronate monooxygenase [Nitrososphaeraceae archaeon]|nr:nitronate monooxygenase [Nitrososphaeraceae archaeon]
MDHLCKELSIPSSAINANDIQLPPSIIPDHLRIILEEEKIPVPGIGLSNPTKLIKQAHASNAKVMAMVTNVEEATKVVKRGLDVVVAQGSEAGRHRLIFQLNTNDEEEVLMVGTLYWYHR